MRATGHSDYESMKPYIEVLNETQRLEMDKWNKYHHQSNIIDMIKNLNVKQLEKVTCYIKNML